MYALFVRDAPSGAWALVYVGQRKSQGIRERLIQHLVKERPKTGSKFKQVQAAVNENSIIGVHVIKVEPESLRLFVEEKIIEAKGDSLIWNQHGVIRKHVRKK